MKRVTLVEPSFDFSFYIVKMLKSKYLSLEMDVKHNHYQRLGNDNFLDSVSEHLLNQCIFIKRQT